MYVFRTFGVATALEIAQNALACAHGEVKSSPLDFGLAKPMGDLWTRVLFSAG
jgi:hypothetical protein